MNPEAIIAEYLQERLGKAVVIVGRKTDAYLSVSVSCCFTAFSTVPKMHYLVSAPDMISSETSLDDALEKARERFSPLTVAQRKRAMALKLMDEAAQLEAAQ